ncbi:MAG: DUF4271 domain-containing protein [Flavobacteriales bacterium]|nr:DUF4271 domain-containing protein [Flavobacteriales bacterium]
MQDTKDSVIYEWFGGAAFLGMQAENQPESNHVLSPEMRKAYGSHLLPADNREPQPILHNREDWIFPLLLIMFTIVAWIRIFHFRGIQFLVKSFIANKPSNQTMLDENLLMKRAAVFLNVLFILSLTLFIDRAMNVVHAGYPGRSTGLMGFGELLLIISALYLVKAAVVKASGFVFELNKVASDYLFNSFLWLKWLGIFLLPLLVLLVYMPAGIDKLLIYIGLLVATLLFAFRLIRGYQVVGTAAGFSRLHMILYLCTLEILPLVVILKLFVSSN